MKTPCIVVALFVFLAPSPSMGYGNEVTVIVGPGLTYDPQFQEINVGDTVVWKWAYAEVGHIINHAMKVPHTVTRSISFEDKCRWLDDKSKKNLGLFTSGYQESGYVYRQTFNKVETVTYHCDTTGPSQINCHGGMWGQINVVPFGARYKYPSKQYKTENSGVIEGLTSIRTDIRKNLIGGVVGGLGSGPISGPFSRVFGG